MVVLFKVLTFLMLIYLYSPTMIEAQGRSLMNLEMVWNDDNTLNQEVFSLITKRLETVSREHIMSWQHALKKATGEEIGLMDLAMDLIIVDRLFEDIQFKENESQALVTRIQVVPDNIVVAWQQALNNLTEANVGKAQTLIYVVQLDPLYPSNGFSEKASEEFISRVTSLPVQALIDWRNVIGRKERLSQIAVKLLLIDEIFEENVFQKDRFHKLTSNRHQN